MRKTAVAAALSCFFLLLCMILFFPDSEKKEEQADRKKIGVSVIGPTHGWAEEVCYYAEKEVRKVAHENDWDYVFVVGRDSNEQSRQVIELVEQRVDCIVMLPMDGASLKTAAIMVQKEDIPIVIFDREIPDFSPTATVKGDNPGIGVLTAEIFNEYFPKGTTVLELMGDTSTVPFQRTDGYDNVIQESFDTIQVGYTDWQRSIAGSMFRQWLANADQEEKEKVEAIYTHDDEIALGVLDVLDGYKEKTGGAKLLPNLKVIAGSSGTRGMYERIHEEEDYYLFSLTYSASMVRDAVRTGEKIIKGEDYEEMTIFPTMEVNKTNVETYLTEE